MTSIRKAGKINGNTTLIDTFMEGIERANAVYLVEGEKKCLIDSGAGNAGAKNILKYLTENNIGLPDIIILTHSHYDHSQGVPLFRKYAEEQGKTIEIMASEKAIPLLQDQSYNTIFEKGSFENIYDVKSLKEGDIVDLGGLTLKIFEIPGHIHDHIAIFDEKNKNLFVGDGIGDKLGDKAFLPPNMPPFFNEDDFFTSINKVKQIDYKSLSFAHFGYIYGDEAKAFLDESISLYNIHKKVIEENMDKIDDIKYMASIMIKELNAVIPEFPIKSMKIKFGLGLVNFFRRIAFKSPFSVGDILFQKFLKLLIEGYLTYKNRVHQE
ncbi:MAG: MBL fold metallo-hydrolase [Promethearchaeota archaeon]